MKAKDLEKLKEYVKKLEEINWSSKTEKYLESIVTEISQIIKNYISDDKMLVQKLGISWSYIVIFYQKRTINGYSETKKECLIYLQAILKELSS